VKLALTPLNATAVAPVKLVAVDGELSTTPLGRKARDRRGLTTVTSCCWSPCLQAWSRSAAPSWPPAPSPGSRG